MFMPDRVVPTGLDIVRRPVPGIEMPGFRRMSRWDLGVLRQAGAKKSGVESPTRHSALATSAAAVQLGEILLDITRSAWYRMYVIRSNRSVEVRKRERNHFEK